METKSRKAGKKMSATSPTRLEGMETQVLQGVFGTATCLRPALRGWKLLNSTPLDYGCRSLRPALRGWKLLAKCRKGRRRARLRPALRGWKPFILTNFYGRVARSPTRLEGMETCQVLSCNHSLSRLRPALRGWKPSLSLNNLHAP